MEKWTFSLLSSEKQAECWTYASSDEGEPFWTELVGSPFGSTGFCEEGLVEQGFSGPVYSSHKGMFSFELYERNDGHEEDSWGQFLVRFAIGKKERLLYIENFPFLLTLLPAFSFLMKE